MRYVVTVKIVVDEESEVDAAAQVQVLLDEVLPGLGPESWEADWDTVEEADELEG